MWCLRSSRRLVDGRTPANQLIWRIYHYLQGFFTSRVVVGDFWTINSSTWKWGRLEKEMNRNWKPSIFRVQLLVQYVCWVWSGWVGWLYIKRSWRRHPIMARWFSTFVMMRQVEGELFILPVTRILTGCHPELASIARRDPHNPCGSYHLFPRINLEEVWKKPSMLHRK